MQRSNDVVEQAQKTDEEKDRQDCPGLSDMRQARHAIRRRRTELPRAYRARGTSIRWRTIPAGVSGITSGAECSSRPNHVGPFSKLISWGVRLVPHERIHPSQFAFKTI